MGVVRNKMIVGVIQARNGSKRLPFKSIYPLGGKPLLHQFIERVKRASLIDKLVLATTENMEDTVLCVIAKNCGIDSFRGSENDLVDRLYNCATKYKADTLVRLSADNPLVEGEEIDRIIRRYNCSKPCNLLFSNTHNINGNGYPDGLGCEVYNMAAFKTLYKNIKDPISREHPHQYFYEQKLVETIECPSHISGHSNLKLDVNTYSEYEYIKSIYDKFDNNSFHFTEYMEVV